MMARASADALLHAAGKFGRAQVSRGGAKADLGERFDGALFRFAATDAVTIDQRERDVFPDGEAVEQRAALEQHAGATAQGVDRLVASCELAIEIDFALIRRQQAKRALDGDGLARA